MAKVPTFAKAFARSWPIAAHSAASVTFSVGRLKAVGDVTRGQPRSLQTCLKRTGQMKKIDRLDGNEELERFLAARRRSLSACNPSPSARSTFSRWLALRLNFLESQISAAVVRSMGASAAFILLFTLKQVAAQRLSKRRARTYLHVARTLHRASLKVLRYELTKHG